MMNGEIKMHDVVALLEDVRTKHFESGQPLLLHRGQIGTVVMTYQGTGARPWVGPVQDIDSLA